MAYACLPRHGNGRFRADCGIFCGIVMTEHEPQMVREDVEPVRRQMWPEALRHLHAAQVGQLRIGLPIGIKGAAPDTEVKRSVVRNHGCPDKIVGELVHDLRKLRRILDMLRPNAVYRYVEGRKPHGARTNQPFLDPDDPITFDPGKADRTGAAALFVGGFEINGDGLAIGSAFNVVMGME